MKNTQEITAGLDVKLKNPAKLYYCIRGFINMRQGEN